MSPRLTPIALSVLVLLSGCGPRTFKSRPGADSTGADSDSFVVLAREAMNRWDAGQDEAAAALTATTLFTALERRPEGPWAARARGLVDSLGFEGDVAGSDHIALVNVRSRTNPQGESWPTLIWHESDGPHRQAMEGGGLRLESLAIRGFDGGFAVDSSQIAAVWLRRGQIGSMPQLMVWRRSRGARWDLAQTLGPDTLGGTGEASFTPTDSGATLETRTFKPTAYFDECPTCPHVHRDRRFAWTAKGFRALDDRPVLTSYSTFTAFIHALIARDNERAAALAVDPMLVEFARHFGWDDPGRGLWRVEPGTSDAMPEMVFFRGSREAFRVTFEARENDWRIAGFEPTERAIE